MNQKELDRYVRDFHQAVVNQQLSLYYQPLYDLRTGKIIGAEALVRWNHHQRGLLPPNWVFLLAEKSGLILLVEEWVIRTACKQNKAWQDAGLPPLVTCVNLSSYALESEQLGSTIQTILDETNLQPHYLELEFTEDSTRDGERTIEILAELKRIGVRISLDDFGKGYSSIQHLSRFPMNKLKIDQSCVKECMSDVTQATVIKTVMAMARSLGLQVTAEGVETQEQLDFLWQLGCDSAQGFWFSEPMPAEDLARVLKREERFRNSAFLLLNGGQHRAIDTYEIDQREGRDVLRKQQHVNESTYRMIAENLSDIIVIINSQGIITYISPSVQSVLEIAPDEVVNRHLLAVLPLETGRLAMQTIRQITVEKQPRLITFTCPDRNGKKITLEAKGTPVIQKEHETNQVIFIIRNHTKHVQTEEFLQKIDKLSVIGQMAAGVAHEIRNPVTSIKGFVQLLRRDQWKREYFDIMQAEFHQLESVLREYVFLSRECTEPYEPKNLANLLRQVTRLVQIKLERHHLVLDVKEVEGASIWCDQNQIQQLFMNLLSNSVESMQDGGTIHIVARHKESEQVMIRIIDQGCGMAEERLKRLGEPFYSTKEKGTGLGLMICYKIMQAHDGYIHFSSTPNKGTTVEVSFPLRKSNPRLDP
ncbi:EAL domain-containing protein [Brevibacillus porteri]|uniref:histidine kinase n=2 Tax=Brevibacillus porteri TaxID=2126350 RepID=A0ABX5FSC8_9BACL|nr:EAL domain-containing protein [Brevibacillus porteri]MED1799360.1 EAL domain-containing protein [Brevibacillus porteri]MED2132252.1 EAL domain-containing protein [Brevibacillus porteri]MED2896470.1 EAL domain-containing protein [Brevibacillus porteri]PSK11991.1 sporulation kinase [Brevibacillus porteri]